MVLSPIPFVVIMDIVAVIMVRVLQATRESTLIDLEVWHDDFGLCNHKQMDGSHNLCDHDG